MLRTLPLAAFCALIVACATTKMDVQWSNPDFKGTSLRGQTVVVACQARDFTTQAVCEQQVANLLAARGVKPVQYASVSEGAPPADDAIAKAAKQTNARAVFRSSLTTFMPAVSPAPTIGIGIGGGSFGGGGGYGAAGGGISMPVGGGTVTEAWAADTAIVDVASGKPVWTGRATTPTGSDTTAQLADLARVTVEALQNNGLL